MMGFVHGCQHPKDKTFTEAELLELTPDHVMKYFNLLAYGKQQPGSNDKPTKCRHTNLEQAKKAISHFHPNKLQPWNAQAKVGNPTRSVPVNDVIKEVKRAKVRKQGVPSRAKRDLKRQEFRKTLRMLEARRGDFDWKLKFPSMLKLQFHIIGRADDICNVETMDLRSHNRFRDFALLTAVSWSKNVMEERECPDQILLGANDVDFCVLLALACYLESKLSAAGDCKCLFGELDDDEEPDRLNRKYQSVLRCIWKQDKFQALLRLIGGALGSHSLRKFASTWCVERGATDNQVEIRRRWKGKKNGKVVNRYISTEQLPTDTKMAEKLCMGGPVKCKCKAESNVSSNFLHELVVPRISRFFAADESNNIADVLGPVLLWACHEEACEHMMSRLVRDRVREAYNRIRGNHPADCNPVEKALLHVFMIENVVHIDELPAQPTDGAGDNGQQLQGPAAIHSNQAFQNTMMIQLQGLATSQSDMWLAMQRDISELRAHQVRNFGIVHKNLRGMHFAPVHRPTNRAPVVLPQQAANQALAQLSPMPRNLHLLWREHTHGLNGRKAAKDFTRRECGANKDKHCRRKHVWDCIAAFVRAGYTEDAAINKIKQAYGVSSSVTTIINCFKRDKKNGGHPNLRT